MSRPRGMIHGRPWQTVVLAAVVVVGGMALLAASTFDSTRSARHERIRFSAEAVEASALLGELATHFGPTGLVHRFKRVVLGGDEVASEVVAAELQALRGTIERYRRFAVDEPDRIALAQLVEVASAYGRGFAHARSLRAMGMDSLVIDARVAVDEGQAAEALRVLVDRAHARVADGLSSTPRSLDVDDALSPILDPRWLAPLVLVAFAVLVHGVRRVRRADRDTEKSNQLVQTILAATPTTILGIAPDGTVSFANLPAESLFGYPREELVGRDVDTLVPPGFQVPAVSLRDLCARLPRRRVAGSRSRLIAHTRSGRRVPVDVSVNMDRASPDGLLIAVLADASEAARAERELKAREEDLKRAQSLARMGSWSWDLIEGCQHWSRGLYRILGVQPGESGDALAEILARVDPPSRDRLSAAVSSALREHTPYSIEYELTRDDGEVRVIHELGEVDVDAQGLPVRMHSALQDVTEERRSQARLMQAAVAFENTNDAIVITDAKRAIVAVNRAYAEITGFEEHEIIGHEPLFLRSDRHDQLFYDAMWESIRDSGSWQGEVWDRKRDGSVHPRWLSMASIAGSDGTVQNYVGVLTDISALKDSQEQLEFLASHDPLTGLSNRARFSQSLQQAIAQASRHSRKLAVLYLDLDRFKQINDTLGHPVGDAVLMTVAERLVECVREEDVVARQGGDEFTILLQDIGGTGDITTVTDKVISAICAPIQVTERDLFVGTSIGVAMFPRDGTSAADVIKNADAAMYEAKQAGGTVVRFYSRRLAEQAKKREALESALRGAIEGGELVLHYQPQYDLASGSVVGAEALVRWDRPGVGELRPSAFIPAADESGLIVPLGEWVIREACAQLARWDEGGYTGLRMSVNLSARQIEAGELEKVIEAALREHAVAPDRLVVEIPECAASGMIGDALRSLEAIRALGVGIAIDAFGTGRSSLCDLGRMRVDAVKIDRSVVADIVTSKDTDNLCAAIVAFAHRLDLTVVAVGVESSEQEAVLAARQCDQVQGFHRGHPMARAEFEAALGTVDEPRRAVG